VQLEHSIVLHVQSANLQISSAEPAGYISATKHRSEINKIWDPSLNGFSSTNFMCGEYEHYSSRKSLLTYNCNLHDCHVSFAAFSVASYANLKFMMFQLKINLTNIQFL
jgi:hypothetical protein